MADHATARDVQAGWRVELGRRSADRAAVDVELAEEVPIALSYGGVAHAVMMGTPLDLADFAIGFTITDGIARDARAVRNLAISNAPERCSIDITLEPPVFQAFLRERRRRSLRGHASCGVCGVEAMSDIPVVDRKLVPGAPVAPRAIAAAVDALRDWQPLSRRTRAAHCAVACAADGAILFGREDVGRHNALDKLIGAAARDGLEWAAGFCLVTSRCSFEMVQKSVAAGITTLAALSAPTALAVGLAREAGLVLVAFAASDPITFAN